MGWSWRFPFYVPFLGPFKGCFIRSIAELAAGVAKHLQRLQRNPHIILESNLSLPVHPGRLTWNLQINHFERKMISQISMTMFLHVYFQGCKPSHKFTVCLILVANLLGEAMQRMKMEAKAHETERRVQLIIIEKDRSGTLGISTYMCNII